MKLNEAKLNENISYVLISLLVLLSFYALLIFSAFDDNALTSWYWVFMDADIKRISMLLVAGLLAAYIFLKTQLLERRPVLFLFASSFFIGMLFWREPEVIIDASRYFTQAKHMEVYGIGYFVREWGREIVAWTDLPAVPFFYGLVFWIFGEERIYIQTFNSLLFSFTILLTYLIGKRLWGSEVGIYAGFLLLAFPYLLTQVPLMLVDVPAMFFLTLSIFACIDALDKGGAGAIAMASTALLLAFSSKFSAWLMLSVLALIFLVIRKEKTLERGIAIAIVSAVLIGAVFLLKFDVLYSQLGLIQSYQLPGLERWGESFVSTFLFQTHPFVTSAALYSFFAAFRKRDTKYPIVGWLVLLIFLLDIKRIRYILPVFPMLALMASYGLNEVQDRKLRKFLASCAVFSSLAVAVFAYLPFLESMSAVNLKSAGEFVDSLDAEHVEVFTVAPPTIYNPAISVALFDMFTDKRIFYTPRVDFYPPEQVEVSPLRFTWAYKNPEYYSYKGQEKIIVVISQNINDSYPNYLEQKLGSYSLYKSFETVGAKPYIYNTIVRVFISL